MHWKTDKSKIEKQISNLDLNENNNNDGKNKPANQKPRNRQMGWGTSDDTKNQKEVCANFSELLYVYI